MTQYQNEQRFYNMHLVEPTPYVARRTACGVACARAHACTHTHTRTHTLEHLGHASGLFAALRGRASGAVLQRYLPLAKCLFVDLQRLARHLLRLFHTKQSKHSWRKVCEPAASNARRGGLAAFCLATQFGKVSQMTAPCSACGPYVAAESPAQTSFTVAMIGSDYESAPVPRRPAQCRSTLVDGLDGRDCRMKIASVPDHVRVRKVHHGHIIDTGRECFAYSHPPRVRSSRAADRTLPPSGSARGCDPRHRRAAPAHR